MSKYYIKSNVKCPFYKHETSGCIYDEASHIYEGMTLHAAFQKPSQRKQFQKQYCLSDYTACPLYALLYKGQ